jgi:hypothetical protein
MSKTKRLASLMSGVSLVVVFVAWLGLRDGLLATVSDGIVVPLLLHGIAWIVLIGGVSLIATASAAMSHANEPDGHGQLDADLQREQCAE